MTWPSEREAWRSPRKIFEWVVLPLFFLTLFGSHRYTFLGPTRSSLSGRGITNVSPFIFGSSWIGSCQIFRSWALKVHSCLQRLFYDHHLLIPLKKEASPCHVLTSTSQMFSICKMDISAFLCYLLNSFTFHSDLNHTVGKLGEKSHKCGRSEQHFIIFSLRCARFIVYILFNHFA